MKRTAVSTLVVLVVVGAGAAALVQTALASGGRPIIVIPITLPLALAAIGALVVSLAIPIRRMTRYRSDPDRAPVDGRGIDPFYATRVVMLAKASALAGALLTGVGAGAVVYLLTRSVTPPVGSIASAVGGLVGAAVLLTCGLVAESMCRVPPGEEDDDDDDKPIRIRP